MPRLAIARRSGRLRGAPGHGRGARRARRRAPQPPGRPVRRRAAVRGARRGATSRWRPSRPRPGVGKGTLFRRFGDRAGLARALLDESERRLQDGFLHGPPPLGPGAPPRARLKAFAGRVLRPARAPRRPDRRRRGRRRALRSPARTACTGCTSAMLVREADPRRGRGAPRRRPARPAVGARASTTGAGCARCPASAWRPATGRWSTASCPAEAIADVDPHRRGAGRARACRPRGGRDDRRGAPAARAGDDDRGGRRDRGGGLRAARRALRRRATPTGSRAASACRSTTRPCTASPASASCARASCSRST